MRAGTVVATGTSEGTESHTRWTAPALRVFELAASLAWIGGSVRYWTQGGSYAAALLILSLLLLGPRLLRMARRGQPASNQPYPPIWLLLLLLFLPEHLTSGGSVVGPHLVPLLLASVCLCAEMLANFTASSGEWIGQHHRAGVGLAAFVAVYGLITTLLAIGKLHAFGYIGQDIGYFMQCLYTGMHGQLFSSNQYHDLLYTRTVSSDFASHNQPVLFLLLPIYWLYPHAETLFIVRNLCMAASAYPAYHLARYHLKPFPALALTIAFLLAPSILFQNFYDYAPLSLVALPLLFALLFYERRQLIPYLAALLLCLFIREDLALVLLGLAAAALLARREIQWVVAPAAIGIVWGCFSWIYLMPHFQHGAASAVESCFSYLGNGPVAMLETMIHHPRLVLTHKALVYTKQLITPFGGVLECFSPISIAAFPMFLINLLGDPGCNAAIIFRHYSLIPSVLLFPGVIAATKKLGASDQSRPRYRTGVVALAVLLASIGTGVLSVGGAELAWWQRADWNQEAEQVAARIPATAAVAVPRYLLPLTANRERVYQSLRLLDYHHPDAEYVVVDRDDARMGVTATWDAHYRDLEAQLRNSRQFQKVYAGQYLDIYRLIGAPLQTLRPAPEAR